MSLLPPFFSIIIPTYGRPIQLADCLASLLTLDYPRDRFEVLVVDDGGRTPLDTVIASFEPKLDVSLLRQPNAGPGPARNMGAAHARGEFLAFTDDDCLAEPGWLSGLAGVLTEAPECMVGGRTVNAAPGICPTTSQLIVDVVYRHYNRDPAQARFIASNNMAMALREFREVGGFDPTFRHAEDRDLCDRWRHRGKRMVYTTAARVRHARPMNAQAFWWQHFSYGRGAERFNRLRAARGSGTMVTESRFHLDVRNWLWYPLTQVPVRRAPAVATLLAIWQVANFAGFMYEKVRGSKDGLHDDALSFS